MAYKVSLCPGDKLYLIEDEVFEWLQPAIDMTKGRFSRDSYCRDIEEGKSQLWIAFDEDELNIEGAIVTTVETYPHKTMLCWALCGGENFHDWHKPMYDLIERFRKEQGLDGSELIGRKAWCRFMKQYGWEERFAFLDFFPEEEGVQNVA